MTDKIDEKVVELLRDGGAGLLPTDTIYGFTCRAEDREAVERLHKLKERNTNKPFIILISDIKMLNMLSISDSGRELVNKYWPGALSVIFPAPAAPAWLTRGTDSLAVRLPADDGLRRKISRIGPIISTSANLQGRPPVHSVKEAKKLFGDKLDFYVNYGSLDNPPSTLVAIIDNKLQVIRQGAVKID